MGFMQSLSSEVCRRSQQQGAAPRACVSAGCVPAVLLHHPPHNHLVLAVSEDLHGAIPNPIQSHDVFLKILWKKFWSKSGLNSLKLQEGFGCLFLAWWGLGALLHFWPGKVVDWVYFVPSFAVMCLGGSNPTLGQFYQEVYCYFNTILTFDTQC